MTRNNEDFSAGLFHGTNAEFKPGDIILPRVTTGSASSFEAQPQMKEFNPDSVAYATDTPEVAHWYANKRVEKEGGKPRVYKVKPVNKRSNKVDPNGGGTKAIAYQSKSGYKVVGEVK